MSRSAQDPGLARRLKWALLAYGALGIMAALTLDGRLRQFVLLLLGLLAFKSWIAVKRASTV